MGAAPDLRIVPSCDGFIDGGLPALIPPGEYQLAATHWQTYRFFGRAPKLAIWFRVVTPGEHFETKLARHYNCKDLVGKPGRNGRFKVAAGSDLVRDYARLLELPGRFDRFDLQSLTRRIIAGRVDTVTTTARQQQLAPAVRYSVVRELLRVDA